MSQYSMTVRRSPFLFIKRLVFIEFFFAVLPFASLAIFNLFLGNVAELYEPLPFARSVPFGLFITLTIASLQILIVIIAFVMWYLPVYVIDRRQVTVRRGALLGDRTLIAIADISQVAVKQGPLARRFDYGTLRLSSLISEEHASLKDIPGPIQYAALLNDMAQERWDDFTVEEVLTASEIVARGERQDVEFKSSLVWDYHQQRANKDLRLPVMKTLAAFMNSSGGYLLIGVADDGRALGLQPDLQTMRAPTLDAFEVSFNMAFNQMIGPEFREYVDICFPELEQEAICLIRVTRSTHPVYLTEKGVEKFYIRAGNASQSLTISQANRYMQRRFDN